MAFSHPLLQAVFEDPRFAVADKLLLFLLPPVGSLPPSSQRTFDFLASHVVPLDRTCTTASSSLTPDMPRPRPSTSASSVLSRFTSSRGFSTDKVKPPSSPLFTSTLSLFSPAATTRPRAHSSSHADMLSFGAQKEALLTTMNDKTLIAHNNIIRTHSGFHNPSATKIQRDAMLYNTDTITHVLLYLDNPIIIVNTAPGLHPDTQPPRRFKHLLDLLPGPATSAIETDLSQLIRKFCDTAMTSRDLDDLHTRTEGFMHEGYSLRRQLEHTLGDTSLLPDPLALSLLNDTFESYLMEQTYDVVFFTIIQLVLPSDLELTEALTDMKYLDFIQVGLPSISGAEKRVHMAVMILEKIGAFRTPAEKLDCLLQTVTVLSSHPGQKDNDEQLDSDALIPLLLLTLVRSRVPHWLANIIYMKEYTFGRNVSTGKCGFALSTLEGLLNYVLESKPQLTAISDENYRFWEALIEGRLEQVQRVFEETDNSPLEEDSAGYITSPPAFPRRSSSASIYPSPSKPCYTVCHSRDEQGNNALLLACMGGHEPIARYVLCRQCGVGASDVNEKGETPLMKAIQADAIDIVRLLLEDTYVKETLHAKDIEGSTAALWACRQTNELILQMLMDHGASMDVQNDQGNSPVHIACQTSAQILELVLQNSPDHMLTWQNHQGQTFLHLCEYRHILQKYLEQISAPLLELADHDGRTPLLSWCARGRFDLVEVFLSHAHVDRLKVDRDGRSALHLMTEALSHRTVVGSASVRGLIEHFKDLIEVRDRIHGDSPLHIAAATTGISPRKRLDRAKEFIRALIQVGANPNLLNDHNERPIRLCRVPSLVDYLDEMCLENHPKPTSSSLELPVAQYSWALTRAAVEWNGQKSAISYIIKSGHRGRPETMRTIRRSMEDFLFLQREILYEMPEAFLPTLQHLVDPMTVDLRPPPSRLTEESVRTLNWFMEWLQQHPSLRQHDLVQSFVRVPEIQRATIKDGSFAKRNLLIEKICDTYSSKPSGEGDEEYFFSYIQMLMKPQLEGFRRLVHAVRQTIMHEQDLHDQLSEVLHSYEQGASLVGLRPDDLETIRVCASLAGDTTNAYTWHTLNATMQTLQDVTDGILLALQRPFSLLKQRTDLRRDLEVQREAFRKSNAWNAGLFSERVNTEQEKEKIFKVFGRKLQLFLRLEGSVAMQVKELISLLDSSVHRH
ncbi:uncharacterized protein BYT42DRAFT_570172 [Radiomyces spectabilis]|uniref:uncharacterized protein n=1 Tax=Radiomyces spectabilis TaxID=64574 RepID=UPI00221F20AD|nr:uncharacterized protein BYT42DRAFT_570172 [Radiomyces spectabilis]KAI8377390.1 hypothetical protein BYT42DRAFT_570172 [Radiomyces spectabilis]